MTVGKGPAFRLGPSRTAGIGAFATRDIVVGEFIIAEKPLIGCHHMMELPFLVSQLPTVNRKAFDSLADAGIHPYPFGKFYTNSFGLGREDDLHAVFEQISRFNHSCDPNIDRRYMLHNERMHLYANRDIKEGSELFISYADQYAPPRDRQSMLETTFNFTCKCSACSCPEDTMGDRRRAIIGRFYNTPYNEQTLAAMERPVEFYKKSAMILRLLDLAMPFNHTGRWDAHDAAAQAALRTGNKSQGKHHYALAYAYCLIHAGPHSSEMPRFRKAMKKPHIRSQVKGMPAYTGGTIEVFCEACGKGEVTITCEKCGCGQYCSTKCQEGHAFVHDMACRILAPMKKDNESLGFEKLQIDSAVDAEA